jgi:hypothetical protein
MTLLVVVDQPERRVAQRSSQVSPLIEAAAWPRTRVSRGTFVLHGSRLRGSDLYGDAEVNCVTFHPTIALDSGCATARAAGGGNLYAAPLVQCRPFASNVGHRLRRSAANDRQTIKVDGEEFPHVATNPEVPRYRNALISDVSRASIFGRAVSECRGKRRKKATRLTFQSLEIQIFSSDDRSIQAPSPSRRRLDPTRSVVRPCAMVATAGCLNQGQHPHGFAFDLTTMH